jgi:hypothetical protein
LDYRASWQNPVAGTFAGKRSDKEEVRVEWPGYFYLSHGHGLIDDVQMPLFVLAVFYAGLFAILGDNKRKEQ